MIASMTAFASASEKMDAGDISCELRSVNHRYLDIHLKMPEALRLLEPAIKSKIKACFSRGKLDVTISIEQFTGDTKDLNLDQALVKTLLNTSKILRDHTGNIITPLSVECILKWPGVMQKDPIDTDTLNNGLFSALDKALQSATNVRDIEGNALKKLLEARISDIHTHLLSIKQQLPDAEARRKKALSDKFTEASLNLEPERLAQEMLLYLQKIDITEEIDRLEMHLLELKNILNQGGVVGRKLDFMMQELNRETNTIASKSTTIDITRHTVEMKVLIEQMREQIQNIE